MSKPSLVEAFAELKRTYGDLHAAEDEQWGEWIRAADVDALARRLEQAQGQIVEALRAARRELQATYGYSTMRVAPLFDQIDAALADPPRAAVPTAKE